jgi:hypothetical protein
MTQIALWSIVTFPQIHRKSSNGRSKVDHREQTFLIANELEMFAETDTYFLLHTKFSLIWVVVTASILSIGYFLNDKNI